MKRNQQKVIDRILDLLTELVDDTPAEKQAEHTIRKLVAQGRVRYIRTGEGERGKILVSKQSLLDYLGGADNCCK